MCRTSISMFMRINAAAAPGLADNRTYLGHQRLTSSP
jgi:hypothetical protein